MINQTMFISFTDPIPSADINQALADIEAATRGTGVVESFTSSHHLAVAGEESIPAFIGTVIFQIGVPDLDALGALFAAPSVDEVFHNLRKIHPYTTAWVNHEPLA
jgi:hypothetical protein